MVSRDSKDFSKNAQERGTRPLLVRYWPEYDKISFKRWLFPQAN
jgi:hypothetical protein